MRNSNLTFFRLLARDRIEVVAIGEQGAHHHEPVVLFVILPIKSDQLALLMCGLLLGFFKCVRIQQEYGFLGVLLSPAEKHSIDVNKLHLFMYSVALVLVDLAKHLVTCLTQTNLEQSVALQMKVKELAISCEARILVDRLVIGDNLLQVEKHSVLFDLLNLLEETWVQSGLLNIEADSTDFLADIKLELVGFHNVYSKNKVLSIGSHYTNHQDQFQGKFLYLEVCLILIIEDVMEKITCLVHCLIRHKEGLGDTIECTR